MIARRLGVALVVCAWAWMIGEAWHAHRFACCSHWPAWWEDGLAWMAMVVAMMVPTTLGAQREVARRSYRSRRTRAVVAYIAGYLACWALVGIAVVALRQLAMFHDPYAAPVLCSVGALWVCLPRRAQWFAACHRQIALRPVGWKADADACRQGRVNGWPCVLMCWPVMLACTATGHSFAMMLGGTALVVIEKRMLRFRRAPIALGSVLLALVALLS